MILFCSKNYFDNKFIRSSPLLAEYFLIHAIKGEIFLISCSFFILYNYDDKTTRENEIKTKDPCRAVRWLGNYVLALNEPSFGRKLSRSPIILRYLRGRGWWVCIKMDASMEQLFDFYKQIQKFKQNTRVSWSVWVFRVIELFLKVLTSTTCRFFSTSHRRYCRIEIESKGFGTSNDGSFVEQDSGLPINLSIDRNISVRFIPREISLFFENKDYFFIQDAIKQTYIKRLSSFFLKSENRSKNKGNRVYEYYFL